MQRRWTMAAKGRGDGARSNNKDKSDSTLIVEMLEEAARELFHSPEGEPYVVLDGRAPSEAWHLEGGDTADLAARMFFDREGRVPGSRALSEAMKALRSVALFTGPKHRV